MLNKEIFIKRNIDSPITLSGQRLPHLLSSPRFHNNSSSEDLQYLFAPFTYSLLSFCLSVFLPLRHQVVWDRYMGVIKSCIFKMYHDWRVFSLRLSPFFSVALPLCFFFCLFALLRLLSYSLGFFAFSVSSSSWWWSASQAPLSPSASLFALVLSVNFGL